MRGDNLYIVSLEPLGLFMDIITLFAYQPHFESILTIQVYSFLSINDSCFFCLKEIMESCRMSGLERKSWMGNLLSSR